MEKLFEEWTEYAVEKKLKNRDISFNLLELSQKKIILKKPGTVRANVSLLLS